MSSENKAFEEIKEADNKGQIGYVCYLCEAYLKDHPDDVPTLTTYACNLISLARYAEAKAALNHAHALVPEKWLHHVLAQRGHLLEAQGEFAQAEEMFMRAHKLDPDDATYFIYMASLAFHRGDLDNAQMLARRATECSEGCIDEAFFNLGGYLLSTGQYQQAADCYRKALALDPNYDLAKERLKDVDLILMRKAQKT